MFDPNDIPLRQPTKVNVSLLEFDPENPRYTPDQNIEGASDVEVIRYLNTNADLGELIQSIATSSYIDIEPLIVLVENDKIYVLEGNRRLAVLKLLNNHDLARDAGIVLPFVPPENIPSFIEVHVYRVADRRDARDFIGFKHINGPHRWESLAKARFAANWYKREKENGTSLRDIAHRMGDRHDTIQRMVAGIYVLEQAQDENIFSVEDRYPGRPFAFSHLYTALTRPGYRQFLGLPDDWRQGDPQPNPVPGDRLDNLEKVMLWLYGSKHDDVRPVVTSQNPHIKELGEVLSHPKARAIMIAQSDLRSAYAEVDTPLLQFEKSLVDAHQQLQNALKRVAAFDGKDETLIQLAAEAYDNAEIILNVMKAKKSKNA